MHVVRPVVPTTLTLRRFVILTVLFMVAITIMYLLLALMYSALAHEAYAVSRGTKGNDTLADDDLLALQKRARKRSYWALGATLSCLVVVTGYDWWAISALAGNANKAGLVVNSIGLIGFVGFVSLYRRTKPVSYGTSIDANGTRHYLYADS